MAKVGCSVPVEEIMKAAERLPPFPTVIWEVTSLLRRMAPAREIEAVIRYDQAIAAKVLTMSCSAYYARRHAISSLRDAIVALGDQQLIQVVMIACVARYFESDLSGYEVREGELWRHAVATALLAETAARRLGKKKVSTIYTAALLHDIGKVVLSFYVKTYLDAILTQMKRRGRGFLDAERETLGVDHQQLGEMIARRWSFPPEIVAGIGCHHHPNAAGSHQEVAAAVYAANRTATAMDVGCGEESLVQSGPEEDEMVKPLGMKPATVGRFWAEMVSLMDEIKELLTCNKMLFAGNLCK